MKTFKPSTIERMIWLSTDEGSHLLVKARGRGWFIDTRRVRGDKPPSKRAIMSCLTNPIESGFVRCDAKQWKL